MFSKASRVFFFTDFYYLKMQVNKIKPNVLLIFNLVFSNSRKPRTLQNNKKTAELKIRQF